MRARSICAATRGEYVATVIRGGENGDAPRQRHDLPARRQKRPPALAAPTVPLDARRHDGSQVAEREGAVGAHAGHDHQLDKGRIAPAGPRRRCVRRFVPHRLCGRPDCPATRTTERLGASAASWPVCLEIGWTILTLSMSRAANSHK